MKPNTSQKSRRKSQNSTKNLLKPSLINEHSITKYNLKDLCRICLLSNESMTSLFSNGNSSLGVMFTSVTTIEVRLGDNMPSQICDTCHTQVVQCYEFKLKCEKSDYTLRKILKDNSIIKEEPPDVKREDEFEGLPETQIKEEEYAEDAEYLDSTCDSEEDTQFLSVFQNTAEIKKEKINVNIPDSNALSKNITVNVNLPEKKKVSFQCPLCSKSFPRSKSLRAHIKGHQPDVKSDSHPCEKCKESFTSEHDLQLHAALHNKGPLWKCIACKKDYKSRSMLRRHVGRHMHSKRYSCSTCAKPFAELYALRRHTRVHTGETLEKKLACHICGKKYREKVQLETHVARHTGERPCVCAACGKAFASRRLLQSHAATHSDLKPYACRYCDKRFRHESTRNTHHRTHTGEKPYVCSFCGKTFVQNSNLNLHLRTHTGEKPYRCDLCEKKFSSGSSLMAHKRVHTGEKPYSCPICSKRFAHMGLKQHMLLHTGERPFSCKACPKRFITAARLKMHCRVHTGERPFECASCTQKFTTKSHLVKHMKLHKRNKKEIVVRRKDRNVTLITPVIQTDNRNEDTSNYIEKSVRDEDIIVSVEDMPMEVCNEFIVGDDDELKANILVVDNSGEVEDYETSSICLSSDDVNIPNGSQVNLVTLNEDEVSISSSSAMLEGATVKLYQLDQSLVQIHSIGGQVTISKIISKMTANF